MAIWIFIADGGFYLHFERSHKGIPITLQYYIRLSQRQLYPKNSFVGRSYLFIMTKFANFLSVSIRKINRKRKTGFQELAFEVRSGSYNANYIILSYLIQYPLLSYKYSNVPIQIELLRLTKSKSYKSVEGLDYLEAQKLNLSYYSASCHWEHINKYGPSLRTGRQ